MTTIEYPRNVRSPRETWTTTSVVIIWDKPERSEKVASFEIYLDGDKVQRSEQLCFKLEHLAPDTSYKVSLKSIDVFGRASESCPQITVQTAEAGPVIDVTKAPYLADNNGRTLVTATIQKAIDDCPPSGTVHIPAGTYVTSGLFLKSNMTLHLDGTLIGSLNLDDYPIHLCRFETFGEFYASMINIGSLSGEVVKNVKLIGSGTVNANGEKLRWEFSTRSSAPYNQRNSTFTTLRCESVYVDGVKFENSCCWSVHPILSDDVTFYNIEIINQGYEVVNGDGLNPDACRNVNILKCLLRSQDDGISIKCGNRDDSYPGQRACEDVLISDCVFKAGFGISPGIQSYYGIRRVKVRNCVFDQTSTIFHPICRRESFAARGMGAAGGVIEDIHLSDIRFYNDQYTDNMWMRGPIDFNMFYTAGPLDNPDYDSDGPIDDEMPIMRNITLENIVIVDRSNRYGITMIGLHETKISNVLLSNIECVSKRGMQIINVDNVLFENLSNIAEEKESSVFRNCDELEISPNLVQNPGFELGNVLWNFTNTRVLDVINTHTSDAKAIHCGMRALKLIAANSKASQNISIKDIDATRFVFRVGGKVFNNGVCGRVTVSALNQENQRIESFAETISFTEQHHLTQELVITVPQGATILRVEAETDGDAFLLEHVDVFPAPRVSGKAFNGDAPCFVYSRGFARKEGNRQSYYGDIHEAVGPDETITFTFSGNRARLFGNKGPEAGAIALTLDDTTLTPITLHADTEQPNHLWFDTGVLQNGHHTIVLTTIADPTPSTTCKTGFDYAYVVSEKC